MGIIRLLLILAAIWLVWRLVRGALLPGRSPAHSDAPQKDAAARMLRCEQCDVHVPETEAFTARGHHFCSQEHQQLWLERHEP